VIGRAGDVAIVGAFAVAGFVLLLATAMSTDYAGLNAGIGSLDHDILVATVAVGALQTLLVLSRLRQDRWTSTSRARVFIASLDGLVVLALSASLLLLVILLWFPDEHVTLASRGFPVTTLWAGIQAVAVLLAEVTARLVLRWLNPA
jgi:hypothetical protein